MGEREKKLSQLNGRHCFPFSIYWPIDLIHEVVVGLTLSQLASCFSFAPLIWNRAFCYPYFSVLPPCKGKIHSGNIKTKETACSKMPYQILTSDTSQNEMLCICPKMQCK